MVVELLGLTASGKTFSALSIANEKHLKLADMGARPIRYLRFFVFSLSNIKLCLALFRILAGETGLRPRLFVYKIKLAVAALAKVQHAVNSKGGVVDGGLYQLLLALFEREIGGDDLKAFPPLFGKFDLKVVVFRVDDEVRQRRLVSRGAAPRVQFGSRYQAEWYRVYVRNYATMSSFVQEHHNCEVVVVSA